jgi:hypothetical protein
LPIDKRLTEMPGDWLECYVARRHDFRWRGATYQLGTWCDCHGRAERVVRICQRCPKERIDIQNPKTLEIYHQDYTKVPGFDARPGEGRLDSLEVRRELRKRVRAEASGKGWH